MVLDRTDLIPLAAAANRAPSVHNTQPARWQREQRGKETVLLLAADLSRQLAIGDPEGRDLGLSCGAALEGMVLALGERGYAATVEDLWARDDRGWRPGYRLVARLTVQPGGLAGETTDKIAADPLACAVDRRFTWRGDFLPADLGLRASLQVLARERPDRTLAMIPEDLAAIAALNDQASLSVMADPAFRRELVAWMRLSPRHPAYHSDGLNLEALRMGRIEGWLAGAVLSSGLFSALDRIGLGPALVSEAAKTRSATGCLLLHRPAGETPLASGRAFYRAWLGVAHLGLAGWPMAALADVASAAAALRVRFGFPADHRLVTVLRVGPAPRPTKKARLADASLVLD